MTARLDAWLARRAVPPNGTAIAASAGMVREMTTDDLKSLWDGDWPPGDVVRGVYIEHVHAELNRRGEGRYCAI
jgi:hypothetical protein